MTSSTATPARKLLAALDRMIAAAHQAEQAKAELLQEQSRKGGSKNE